MTSGPAPVPPVPRDLVGILRSFASRYITARRSADDLRSRLGAILREETQWREAATHREHHVRAEAELVEVERVRRALERSARVSDERLGALEDVIAAVVGEAGRRLREHRLHAPPKISPAPRGQHPGVARPRTDEMRWSPREPT